jgi:hypothetical protein
MVEQRKKQNKKCISRIRITLNKQEAWYVQVIKLKQTNGKLEE